MSILDIRLQKLFVLALTLKVFLSGLGWYLQMPWTLGFAAPLAVMAAYIGLGLYRRDTDVSDEKFADTAYYLGFIFTITSIIFSLFDLPHIGTRIQDIAVRFGAAMVSTVLGLGVRVYLVSFRVDVSDAIRDAEDTLLGATRAFTERLTMSLERLQDFESRVDLAARSSVERVNLQVEALSKNHAEKLTEFFSDLTTRNRDGFTKALDEVSGATSRLAGSVDAYAGGMNTHLTSLEARVTTFAAAVGTRLQKTTFPDDFFVKRLQAPLEQLEVAANSVAKQVTAVGEEMAKTTGTLAKSLEAVHEKSAHAESAMDSVLKLAGQQHLVLQTGQSQLNVLSELTSKLAAFDELLTRMVNEVKAGHEHSSALSNQVQDMVKESGENRQAIVGTLESLAASLNAQSATQSGVSSRMDATVTATERLVEQLARSASAQALAASHLESSAQLSSQVATRLAATGEGESTAAHALTSLNAKADRTVQMITDATLRLQEIAVLAKQFVIDRPILVGGVGYPTGRTLDGGPVLKHETSALSGVGVQSPLIVSSRPASVGTEDSSPFPHRLHSEASTPAQSSDAAEPSSAQVPTTAPSSLMNRFDR